MVLSSRSVPGGRRWAEGLCGGGNDDVVVAVLRGVQKLPGGDDLHLQVAVVRLGAQRCGSGQCGLVRLGAVRRGAARRGAVRLGAVQLGATARPEKSTLS